MQGQWTGTLSGATPGAAFVNIDDRETHYSGSAYFQPSESGVPSTFARFKTDGRGVSHEVVATIEPVHPSGGRPLSWDELRQHFPDVVHSDSATISLQLEGAKLTVAFSTDVGTAAAGELDLSTAGMPSDLVPEIGISDWKSFKEYAANLTPYTLMFRGQPVRQRLRTAFHRRGRSDLDRYVREDVPVLQHAIAAKAARFLLLQNPVETGAFYNLVQHHGFPTPVLDWTYSPFIAAFFAYRRKDHDEKVRIFVLDRAEWERNNLTSQSAFTYTAPNLTPVELPAIENDRAGPQQAIQTITNIDDIEAYIKLCEGHCGQTLLRAIDLPRSERTSVLTELSQMGITAGSLFPGIDGTCEQLRNRLFGIDDE